MKHEILKCKRTPHGATENRSIKTKMGQFGRDEETCVIYEFGWENPYRPTEGMKIWEKDTGLFVGICSLL